MSEETSFASKVWILVNLENGYCFEISQQTFKPSQYPPKVSSAPTDWVEYVPAALLAAKDAKLSDLEAKYAAMEKERKEAEAALEDVPCICEYFFEASNKEQLAHQCDRCAALAKLRGES